MGRLITRFAATIRDWMEAIAPNPELQLMRAVANNWERAAKDSLNLLEKASTAFNDNMTQLKIHYSVLERSYSSYIANNAGIKIKLRMNKEWPEQYEVVVSVPPQLGLYLMDKKWTLPDKGIHVSNFARAVSKHVEVETYNFLVNHINEKEGKA